MAGEQLFSKFVIKGGGKTFTEQSTILIFRQKPIRLIVVNAAVIETYTVNPPTTKVAGGFTGRENDMSIKFIDGNIFSRLSASKPTYICQQVNCKGVMGAGLAMQICIQWPVVYQRYLEFCYGNNGNKLGTYQEVLVEPKLYVVNLFGQNGYGRGKRQTNYAALAAALFSFFRDCAQKNQDVTIRLPYGLGCGLAGGDWNTVLDIISDAAKAWNVNVEIWKL